MPIERKLAAIMFTDIAGYTALSAKDSTKASELLKTQRDILKPIVKKHGGSWMKEMGDGLLLTFDSATSSVECSIAIQEATKNMEDLNLRIGIHEGEVIKQDGDVIGDDVNVASRIEPFSAVGGVAISDKVYRAISSNKEFETKYIGQPKLKGVSQKVEVYCITSYGLPETDISKISHNLINSKKKVNVITTIGIVTLGIIGFISWYLYPFITLPENISKQFDKSIAITYFDYKGVPEETYWSVGLTDELISRLSKIDNIKVSSRVDVDPNRLKEASIFQLKKDLMVDYILKGSIINIDDQIKINTMLIETANESIVWSDTYVRKIDNILELQIELAKDIINNLSVKISSETIFKEKDFSITDFRAYKMYLELTSDLKNRYIITDEDYNELFGQIDQILEIDSNYVQALETKCFFLFDQYLTIYEKSKDKDGVLHLDTNSQSKMNKIKEEVIKKSNKILQIDQSNKFALASTAGIPFFTSLESNLATQVFAFRETISRAKQLLIEHPESILANTFMFHLYDMKTQLFPFSNDQDLDLMIFYLDKVINKSKKYIESSNMDFLDIMCIGGLYDEKNKYSKLSLDEKEMLFTDMYSLMKNNRFINGQRNANQKLFFIARKKKDFQKAIELANENLALSKLINSKRTKTWAYIDLHSIYYHDLHRYTIGLEYQEKALGTVSNIDMWAGDDPVRWHCHYSQDLTRSAQYNKAKEQINIASKFSSSKYDSLRLYNTIGYLYYNMEAYQAAVENFEKAILYFTDEDKLEYTSILYYLGSSYYYLREYDDSITSYTKCLQYAKDQQDWIYAINNKLALTYATIGQLEDSKRYYSISNELNDVVDNKQFWTLYKINQKYGDNDLAVAYLDSSYTRLLNNATGYTNEHDRQNYLQNDKWNKCLQEEWERVK